MLSIIIPANNEAAHIGACLSALLASTGPDGVQVIVAANGCSDATVALAEAFHSQAEAQGWQLSVMDLPALGKIGTLNAADEAARFGSRVYLDADVVVEPDLMAQLFDALDQEAPVYASGQLQLAPAQSWTTRAYARIYARVPFVTDGVPGAGLFAVNAAGRTRWAEFPDIISDDTFVRLSFAPNERIGVPAGYSWPLVEGFSNLVRVRRRQNAGVAQVGALFADLIHNDDKHSLGISGIAKLAMSDPLGFAIYGGVSLMVKLRPQQGTDWERGR